MRALEPTVTQGADRAPDEPISARGRLAALSWAHFLNDGAANFLPGILPLVLLELHQPAKMAGVLVAALWIGQTTQPLMGWIADRVGGRLLIVVGLLASSLGGAMLGMAHSMAALIALLVVIGLGSSMFHPQALAAVRALTRSRHGISTSAFLVGGELGRGVWPTVTTLIGVHLGLASLWVVAIPALVTIPLLLRWAPRLPANRGRGNAVRWRRHARPMTLLVAFRGAQSLMMFGTVGFLPVLWHVRGGDVVAGASIVTTLLVVGVVGNLLGGHLADTWGRRPLLLVSALASSALIAALVLVQGVWVWVVAGLLGMAMFLAASTNILIGQDIFPENRSMGSGIALGLAGGVGALLVLALSLTVQGSDVLPIFWVFAGAGAASSLLPLAFTPEMLGRGQA